MPHEQAILGKIKELYKARGRGRQLECSLCNEAGATVDCATSKCEEVFHFEVRPCFRAFMSTCRHRALRVAPYVERGGAFHPATCNRSCGALLDRATHHPRADDIVGVFSFSHAPNTTHVAHAFGR